MVWLQTKEIKEFAEEVGCGEGESTLEMGKENDPLAGFGCRGALVSSTSDSDG